MKIQFSFLGKARQDPHTGYRKARYRFDDGIERETAFFGPALATVIRPDQIYVLGTAGSMWDVLLEAQGGDAAPEEERMNLLVRAAVGTVDESLLAGFEPLISERLGVSCRLRVISYLDTPGDQVTLVARLAEWLNPNDRVVFDVTHGLRHLPMLMLAAARYLERLKGVTVEDIFYGALEMSEDGPTPVLRLTGLLRLLDWIEALAVYDQVGDYGVLAPLLRKSGVAEEMVRHLERAAHGERVFNHDMARQNLLPLQDLLSEGLPDEAALFTDALRQRIGWVNDNLSHRRLAAIARERLGHGDYVRAAIAATSAFLTSLANPCEKLSDYNTHEKIENEFRQGSRGHIEKMDDYEQLKRLRNAMAHGTPAKNNDIRRALADERLLRETLERLINRLLT